MVWHLILIEKLSRDMQCLVTQWSLGCIGIRVWMPGSFSLIMMKFLFFSVHIGIKFTVACRLNCIKCEDTIFYLFFIKSRFGKPYIALIQEFFICLFHFQDFMYSLYFRHIVDTTATCFKISYFCLFLFSVSIFLVSFFLFFFI